MQHEHRPRVLLVDDNEDFRLMWRLLLTHDGRFGPLREAPSGEDAIRGLVLGGVPDVVVSDIRMGAVSGLDVLEAVRSLSPTTPVLLTSNAEGARADATRHGASAFLPKSLTMSELLPDRLWRLLEESTAAVPGTPGAVSSFEGSCSSSSPTTPPPSCPSAAGRWSST